MDKTDYEIIKPWREKNKGKLCNWCHTKLPDGVTIFCSQEHRDQYNAWIREYMKEYRKVRAKFRKSAKKEELLKDASGTVYKVKEKLLVSNPKLATLDDEEVEEMKNRLKKNFNATQVRPEGLVFLKVKKVEQPTEEKKDEEDQST